ncbi:Eukaryotic translation initiation factor 2C [Tulasnella sp. 408]|nr:Eukaryotic translation initiation factor 2C [Tulasnella sp. 408]
MVEFSTLRPDARLRNIRNGLQQLSYGNSAYLQDFGINVDANPMTIKGRILPTPTLMYGRNSSIVPRDGQWNMRDKMLYRPERIAGCAILIYDARFRPESERHLKETLYQACQAVGIQGMPQDPPVLRKNAGGGQYWNHIKELGTLHKQVKGAMPNLIIVVLPDFGNEDIYVRIKK